MADFSTIEYQANTGTNGTPVWTNVLGAGRSLRFSDSAAAGLATAAAAWPNITRPASTAIVSYAYAFTADTTGLGVIGNTGAPTAFSITNELMYRWHWDNVGTFASAPIFTMYASTAHASITRGDGSILGGHATDTGATARSYYKGNAFGRVVSAGAPAADPSNAPAVTDGSTGAATPSAGANWLTNFQSLQGDNDYIQFPSTPAATTADQWNTMLVPFVGPNLSAGVYSAVVGSLRYTYS